MRISFHVTFNIPLFDLSLTHFVYVLSNYVVSLSSFCFEKHIHEKFEYSQHILSHPNSIPEVILNQHVCLWWRFFMSSKFPPRFRTEYYRSHGNFRLFLSLKKNKNISPTIFILFVPRAKTWDMWKAFDCLKIIKKIDLVKNLKLPETPCMKRALIYR